MKQELLDLLDTNPSMVNLSRSLPRNYKKLYDWVIMNPVNYPSDVSFNERVYGIKNNFDTIPVDENGNRKRFINYFSGYSGDDHNKIPATLENIILYSDTAVINTRLFKTKYKNLYDEVLKLTSNFREDCKFNERLYCVVNKIPQQDYRFVNFNKGYNTSRKYISEADKVKFNNELETEYLRLANRTGSNDVDHGKQLYNHKKHCEEFYKDLYDDDKVEDVDFKYEPVLGIRTKMITSSYVTNILKMDVDHYDSLYPNKRGRCSSNVEKIKQIQNTVGSDGLTPRQKTNLKRDEKLKTPDENGVTGYQKNGRKTRDTHMRNIDADGRNGYQQQAHKRVTHICENGLTVQQNADIKRDKKIIENQNSFTRASSLSKKALKPILEYFEDNNLKFNFDNHEYAIFCPDSNKSFFFDLVCSELKIAIEYQSLVYHSDPKMNDDEWNAWTKLRTNETSTEAHNEDIKKARSLYKNRGYITFWVWQRSEKEDVNLILEYIKSLREKK